MDYPLHLFNRGCKFLNCGKFSKKFFRCLQAKMSLK